MVSIKDVAEHAGTSFKTVSRVINNDPGVREETRERVQASIDALGYRPNSAARMMRNQKSGVIGFISDEVVTQPYAGELLLGAQEVASEHDKVLMVVNIEHDRKRQQRAIDMLLERRVEALVYASYYHREIELPQEMLQVPSVLVNCFTTEAELPTFVPDEVQAGYDATRLLIEQGHSRIGMITLNPQIVASRKRLEGYRRALDEAGIAFDGELIVQGEPRFDESAEAASVAFAVDTLMALDKRPTALVCGKDEFAMQVYFLLARFGLQVGRDLAVTSFDNQRLIAPGLTPGLTTMELPHLEMGRAALHCLFNRTDDRSTRLIPFSPIVRESHRLKV
ncbi:LacI family DNA-binding transcriptional regulator [Marinobacterium sp. D7]|uniref:LacI family DNA-binding transcriptional regulator n=1 Tax=Marinobacterium ramblicola TaxID=2849041 RepID=UPI001C2DAE6D|nr:LacI family DNA-binding transcriptional regulator [Marinobacterium ramblicola]MBV1787630.1 LacI family DNA-binding transcriptional regulator [Marinobacterium ramblicola]